MKRAVLLGAVSAIALSCGGAQPPAPSDPGAQPAPPGTPVMEASPQPVAVVEVPPAEAEPEPATEPSRVDLEGGEWGMFHGGRERHGVAALPAIQQPRIRWKAKVGIQGWLNSPISIGNLVIVPSSGAAHNTPDAGDGVVALDLKSGQRAWFTQFGQDANGAAATKERVFATSDDGSVYGLESRTGKVLWKQPGQGKMYTHPLLFKDLVIVGDAGGYVRAFNANTGNPKWALQLIGAIRGGASADQTHIYVASQAGEVAKLDEAGKALWRVRAESRSWDGKKDQPVQIYSPLISHEGVVIVPFSRDTYYRDQPGILALDKKSGKTVWRGKGPGDWGNVRTTPVLVGGALVYAEPYSGDIAALSAATGRMIYRTTVGACFFPAWATAAAASDVVYIPRFDSIVHAVRASDGSRLWQIYLGDSRKAGGPVPKEISGMQGCEWDVPAGSAAYSPAAIAGDGALLVGTHEGFLYAIEDRR